MGEKKGRKKEPWRWVAGILAIAFIVYMWVKKDIASVYSTMPKEQVLPLIVTTAAVTLLKVAALAAAIFLVKWIMGKLRNRDR